MMERANDETSSSNGPDTLSSAGPKPKQRTIVIELTHRQLKVSLTCVTLLVLVIAIGFGLWIEDDHWRSSPEDFRQMGPEALALFRQHDVNDDGILDIREFEPLAHFLVDVNVTLAYELPISPDDNVITIGSYFQPLDIETMQLVYNNHYALNTPEMGPLSALIKWTKPVVEMKNFATHDFELFLPRTGGKDLVIGSAYHITPFGVQSDEDLPHIKHAIMSSNRYYPPRVTGNQISLHNLLAMLHPRPFIHTRFPPRGSMACVRAYSEDWLDISFRVHTEFQLQETPNHPFWFTPAQFKGRLVVNKDLTHIKYFRMYVPNNRRLNVDMEWLKNDPESSMEVDIGYMPQMELRSTGSSRPATYDGYDLRTSLKPETSPSEEALEDLTWTQEAQVDVCERAMEVVFYPFTTVPYYNYTDAYRVASDEEKLIHSIILWGALDDQSC